LSRPVGAKNKPKDFSQQARERDKTLYPSVLTPVVIQDKLATPVPPVLERRAEPIRYDALFGIRVLRNGPFKGLWELVQLDNEGKRNVLTDANSRGMVVNLVNRQIMKIVVVM